MGEYLRLLHISDPHITAKPRRSGDYKVQQPGVGSAIEGHPEKVWLEQFRVFLQRRPEDEWPTAVIVSGDLVDKRWDVAAEDPADDFAAAESFLRELDSLLGLRDSRRILVVPGNHDVNWRPGLSLDERFGTYLDHVRRFTSPRVDRYGIQPEFKDLTEISGVPVHVSLLVSPTFSGVRDEAHARLVERMDEMLSALPEDIRTQVKEKLQRATGALDIAIIGHQQLEAMGRAGSGHPDPIRIAVLHHHLLPDPGIELAPFESVVDAGAVLDHLIRLDYDLVLTGHKHNRRLVQYRKDGKGMLDIYSAPSLLWNGTTNGPGFTFLDLYPPTEPHYARLHCYSMVGELLEDRRLVRRGTMHPDLERTVTTIPLAAQEQRLLPIAQALQSALRWRDTFVASHLFDEVLEKFQKDFTELGQQRLVFRAEMLNPAWRELIGLAATRRDPSIRMASSNDLKYWLRALDGDEDARAYSEPLSEFTGSKTRILIFDSAFFDWPEAVENIGRVIAWMRADGFRVLVVNRQRVSSRDFCDDFGIVADLCVSHFSQGRGDRSLSEDFSERAMRRHEQSWRVLLDALPWDSNRKGGPDFSAWTAQQGT
jgi:3',5'-cyclic AMP phosphodiesterase CpdA